MTFHSSDRNQNNTILTGTTTADQCQACKKIFNFISNVTHNGDDNLKGKLAELCSEYSYMPGKQARDWVCFLVTEDFVPF